MPGTETQTQTPAPVLAKTIIPQDLHDREYIKPWLDKELTPELHAEIFKKLDGSQALLGKKRGIPAADAKPEEIDAFYGELRPQKPEDYEIALLSEKPDEEFIKVLRSAAYESGASKRTMKLLTDKLMPFLKARGESMTAAHAAEQQKMEEEYAALVKETMGEGWDKKQGRVMTAMKELLPEGAKKFIDKLSNNDLALVVTAVDAILSKYAKEDDFNSGGNSHSGATDKDGLVAELRKLYAHPGWKNFTDPDSAKVRKRVEEILAMPQMKA